MDHPFTPPACIPASLPTPKKEKKEAYFNAPQASDAHLTEDELNQLTRHSFEAGRPGFGRSHSRDSHSGSQSSGDYGRRYGRSVSVSSGRRHASIPGPTGLDLMQASYSSTNILHQPQPYAPRSHHLSGSDLQLSGERVPLFSDSSDQKGGELQDSNDGPSAPSSFLQPNPAAHHLVGSDLHLPDSMACTPGHSPPLNDAGPQTPDLSIRPPVLSPYPPAPHTIDKLETSASVAALLLKSLDEQDAKAQDKLPVDDSSAPIPPPLPTQEGSFVMIPPPSVVALISNLGGQGDSSSDRDWPLPAKTPVFTFIPPPASASPIASTLEASVPSAVPSPIGSPITATRQQPVNSFIPPPRTMPVEASQVGVGRQESLSSFIPPPRTMTAEASPVTAPQQQPLNSFIPPPHVIATSIAPYNQPFSTTPNSMAPSKQDYQPGFNANPATISPYTLPSSRPLSTQPPVELSAFNNTVVQKPTTRIPVPSQSSSHNTGPTHLTKPQPVALIDAALAAQPPFRHGSKLNHDPNTGLQPIDIANILPPSGQAPPIDQQLPAIAPSLKIETVSFPNLPAKEPSFWRRRKKTLIILLVLVLLGIAVGIVFVAHSFYRRWGGVGFLKKRGAEIDNSVGYLQAANGDILAHQDGEEGKKGGKGLLEGMLVGGYKRGWGAEFGDEEAEPAPVPVPGKKVKHITVIPVGSSPNLPNPFDIDTSIGPSWWNERVIEMQKRGEELISSHPSTEDALEHAAALVQRFVDEIRSRALAGAPGAAIEEAAKPPARLFDADGSDKAMLPQEMAQELASDYVNRVPEDVANNYDLEVLMSSMDALEMKRPAQEVAMLAAQGYISRVPEDVTEMIEAREIKIGSRGYLSARDIERAMMGEDVKESQDATVTVTKTRINIGAPTGLTPQDMAKQFAGSYVESLPREVEVAAGSLYAKRWAARSAESRAEVDDMPDSEGRAVSGVDVAMANAAAYSEKIPSQAPSEQGEVMDTPPVTKREVGRRGEMDSMPDSDGRVVSAMDVAMANAADYSSKPPSHIPAFSGATDESEVGGTEAAKRAAARYLAALKSEEVAGRWSDDDEEVGKRKNPPFVACGNGRRGCEAHGHPEICCQPDHTCFPSPTTNSGVICCRGVQDCGEEGIIQAYCPPSTVPCPVELGGGCCPTLDQCAANGCLEFEKGYSPSDGPAKASTETRKLTMTVERPVAPGQTEVVVEGGVVTTVVEMVGGDVRVVATLVKDGEVLTGMGEGEGVVAEETGKGGGGVKSMGVRMRRRGRGRVGWMALQLGAVAGGMVWL